ncbi:DinB family protein [Sinorhizobium sp. CCBAU 05631]|uniref:DinB family protein n=1 Tax=Sinorhizobium sp. CCBAU 05631 TaxID=794846 RepID=UPI003299998F
MDRTTFSPDLVCRPYRQLARNARLANARLDRACMALQPGEWEAARTSFFPSLKETMVHLLNADRYYIDTLRGDLAGPPNPPGSRAPPPNSRPSGRRSTTGWSISARR